MVDPIEEKGTFPCPLVYLRNDFIENSLTFTIYTPYRLPVSDL